MALEMRFCGRPEERSKGGSGSHFLARDMGGGMVRSREANPIAIFMSSG